MTTQAGRLPPEQEHQSLAETVWRTVGLYLGTGVVTHTSHPKAEPSPIAAGALATGLYAVLPMLQMLRMPNSHELVLLSWWGAIYFGIVVAITRSTSHTIIEIVEVLLLPNISEDLARSVRENIAESFGRRSGLFPGSQESACSCVAPVTFD